MEKYSKKIISFLFVIILFSPIIITSLVFVIKPNFFKERLIKMSINKSNYIEVISELVEKIKNIDYYLPYGQLLSAYNSKYKYILSKKIVSRSVKEGKKDWLFYGKPTDGDLFKDYQGLNIPTKAELTNIINNFNKSIIFFKNKGIKPILLVCPNKGQIYPQYLPDEIKLSKVTTTNYIVSFLNQNLSIPIIYPEKQLIEYSKIMETYYSKDTHWNSIGGLIATNVLIEEGFSYKSKISINSIDIKSGKRENDDIIKMLNLKGLIEPSTEYSVDLRNKTQSFVNNNETIYRNPIAIYDDSVLLIGDSYRIAIIPYLSYYFKEVICIRRNDYSAQILNNYKPDYVIMEFVGRRLVSMKDFDFSKQ